MILLIDNYDSFTYNLVHLIGALGVDVVVKRNDALTVNDAFAMSPSAVVLSPGPCSPNEAGICLGMVERAIETKTPLLGVCLGHQSLVQAAGGTVGRAQRLMHGRTSQVTHNGDALFKGIPSPFTATRYHSLTALAANIPDTVKVLAHAEDDGEIMAARYADLPIWGVQFHPESIASEHGDTLMTNFLSAAKVERRAA